MGESQKPGSSPTRSAGDPPPVPRAIRSPSCGQDARDTARQRRALRLGVTHRTWERARDAIRQHLTSLLPAQVVTLTPEMCVRASEDPEFRTIIDNAAIVVAEGVGVVWGEGRLTGKRPQKIPGIELGTWALEEVDRIAGKVYLLGSRQEVVEKAADRLSIDFPRLSLVGHHHGYFSPDEEPQVVAGIAETEPHLLLVGMGSPKQERFIAAHLDKLSCAIAMGVGGSFDIWSGAVRRAPAIFRKTGTEWLYRTLTQPGPRLKRIPTLWRFIGLILRPRSGAPHNRSKA